MSAIYTTQSSHTHRRAKRSLARGEGVRALIVVAGLVGAFLLTFYIGVNVHFFNSAHSNSPRSGTRPDPQQQVEQQQGESPNRHASILFFPRTGDSCEKRRFDNITGQFMSDGYVSCEAELAHEYNRPADNTARIRAILDAFKK